MMLLIDVREIIMLICKRQFLNRRFFVIVVVINYCEDCLVLLQQKQYWTTVQRTGTVGYNGTVPLFLCAPIVSG